MKRTLFLGVLLIIVGANFMACNSSNTERQTDVPKSETKTITEQSSKTTEIPSTKTEHPTAPINWAGSYEKEAITLKIEGPDEAGGLDFTLTQGGERCAELTEGIADLTDDKTAVYYDEYIDCQLTFRFLDGTIEIREANCEELHGAACQSYDGIYEQGSTQVE